MIGFHVELEDEYQDFLSLLVQANVKVIKLHIPLEARSKDVGEVCRFLYKNKIKAYVSIFGVHQEEVQHDPIFPYILERNKLFGRYEEVLRWIKPITPIIGIGLIDNVHRLIKVKGHGFSRREVKDIVRQMIDLVGGEFPTVLNCRDEDLSSGHWGGIDCDIYDVKGTTTPKDRKKPVWVSDIRVEKGFITKSQKLKILDAAKKCRSENTFIYSRDVDGFCWGDVIRGMNFNEEDIRSYKAK